MNGGDVPGISGLPAGSYSVTISDNAACDTTISFTLIDPPAFQTTVTEVDPDCNGASTGSITVTNIVNGSGGYVNDWGTAGGDVMAITGVTAGSYTLTVTDNVGCSISFNYSLVDPTAHAAAFNATPTFLDVTFANTSIGGGTSSWDFGDLNTSTQTSPAHTYASAGTYNVCLTQTTSCGVYTTCSDVTDNQRCINWLIG